MIILGYSGLDGSVDYKIQEKGLQPGEERIVQGLDSAAGIIVDGNVIAAAAEERFIFQKKTNRFPVNAIRYCIKEAGISFEQIDCIAHGFNYGDAKEIFTMMDNEYYTAVLSPERQVALWTDTFDINWDRTRFQPVNHHLAHAASAYFPSGYNDALCMVCDGMGELNAISIYRIKNKEFLLLDGVSLSDSIGILYSIITKHLGFKFNSDEYKVMGLAPYGDAKKYRAFFESVVTLKDRGKYTLNYYKLLGRNRNDPNHRQILEYIDNNVIPHRNAGDNLNEKYCDFAAAAQECIEKVLFHVLEYWRSKTGINKICMAGGVLLNCTFNGKLIDKQLFDDIYIQPASGDDGTSLGAAYYVAAQHNENIQPKNRKHLPFYGPAYTKNEILSAIGKYKEAIIINDLGTVENAAEDAANAIHNDMVVAWFQDRMEFGPRALGNRSILANPTKKDIKKRLNEIVKLREGFRPFAPAVLEEKASEYFELTRKDPFYYMLSVCKVKQEWGKKLPGITHVDSSARVQTVSARENRSFYNVIKAFGDLSGVYCVVNTSLNMRSQPIILSPEIAIATFLKVKIEILYMGSIRISKKFNTKTDIPRL